MTAYPSPLVFVPLSEIARQGRITTRLARTRLAKAGIVPDGMVVNGSAAGPLPIFENSRATKLLEIVTADPIYAATS